MTMTETTRPPAPGRVDVTPAARAGLKATASPKVREAVRKAHPAEPRTGADPVDVYVGAEIRARRRRLDLSQTDLANACRVTFQQVQKYERGANRVSASMLVRIASALRCKPGDMFPSTGEDASKPSPLVADAFAVAGKTHGQAFLALAAEADDEDVTAAYHVLKVLSELRGSRPRRRR